LTLLRLLLAPLCFNTSGRDISAYFIVQRLNSITFGHSLSTLFTAFLLQACGSQTTKAEAETPEDGQQSSEQAFTEIYKNNPANANTLELGRPTT